MDSGHCSTIATGRRMRLVGVTDGTATTTAISSTTTVIDDATTAAAVVAAAASSTSLRTTIGARCDDNVTVSTVRPTTHQKVRRILEDRNDYQKNGGPCRRVKRASVVPCTVNNYSIVASRGELARINNAPCETSSVIARKRTTSLVNGKIRAKEDDARCIVYGKSSRKQSPKDDVKDSTRSRTTKSPLRALTKSPSAPAVSDFKEGFSSRDKTLSKLPHESILKRSSAFLANLTHSSGRSSVKKENRQSPEKASKALRSLTSNEFATPTSRCSSLRGYLSILTGGDEDLRSLKRSPSIRTLPTGWKKKSSVGVKKSVSFSSDTSFEEKRAPFRSTAVHEAKVYHKGVLQDRDVRGDNTQAKVPPSWESPSGGPEDLLRAAREVDDAVLKEIVVRARKLGSGDMDINLADSSGRTAVSYMAGNGAAATLELALSFEGVDPNLPDNEGNTPLHFAAQAGQAECLNILLQRCPDIEVDARNTLGFTPLMKAALQGRTKCAKILLFAGANPTLRDHGRGLRAEQWARFCGRYVCAEVIERFARHRLLERTTSCRWGSEPELAAKVLQGKVTPVPVAPLPSPSSGLKSKIRKVFRTTSGPDRTFSLVSQLTSAALCASSPALPKQSEVPPVVKSLLRPLSVPQLRVTLVAPQEILDKSPEKYGTSFVEKIENAISKPPRTKKKSK